MKKVLVSGCFDMLHSGHVAFLSEAATYGELYIGLGADETIFDLKGRYPINNQAERKYMLEALKSVKKCYVNSGSGILDFMETLDTVKPDLFVVNEDGTTPEKESYIKQKGIEYIVLKRIPFANLPIRSTTSLRTINTIPYRIDLAGGWLDQPYVSKHHAGSVVTISIEPTIEFNERSGMATSTRRKAIELWNSDLPSGDPRKLAKILFSYENPPGTNEFSGSQDALGIIMPGLNKYYYENDYWPSQISTESSEEILSWIEKHLYLINLGPRHSGYDVLDNTKINVANARLLADAAENCWNSILKMDISGFGKAFRESFEAQIRMFPNMMCNSIQTIIEKYKELAHGWKLSGAGGGGYLIFVAEKEITNAIRIKIRRKAYD